MAIRFPCPSCQQPIETDDAWGGQSVACPYCRKVVVAPRESSWPPGEIPVASPVPPGFGPPPPPPGHPGAASVPAPGGALLRREGPVSAGWALLLAVASAALLGIGTLIYSLHLSVLVFQKVGEKATLEQQQKAMIEIMPKVPITPATATCLFVGAFCGIAGLALGVRSLVRAEGHTGKAIAACVLAGIAVFCQILLTIALTGTTSAR